MRVVALLAAGLALLVACGVFIGRRALESALTSPVEPGGAPRLVEVPEGETPVSLVHRLAEARLVPQGPLLALYAEHLRPPRPLVAGEYRLNPSSAPLQLMHKVEAGQRFEHTVTLRAGSTLEAIAQALADAQLTEPEAFLAAAADPDLLASLGVDGPSAEGFVFADVWSLPRGLEPAELLTRLVRRFFDSMPDLDRASARLGFTVRELVTLASLVEAGPIPSAERRLYAAMLIERMQHGYALESEASDAYGRARPGAPADPREDPWNTTARVGLPPSPIGAPSLAAVLATVEPADTEPLFMVRRGAGRHVYCPDLGCLEAATREHQPGTRPHRPLRAPLGRR